MLTELQLRLILLSTTMLLLLSLWCFCNPLSHSVFIVYGLTLYHSWIGGIEDEDGFPDETPEDPDGASFYDQSMISTMALRLMAATGV